MDIGLCLFLADRPFRLGHLEISFGICSKLKTDSPVGLIAREKDSAKEASARLSLEGPIM